MSREITINETTKYKLNPGEAYEDIKTLGPRYAKIYRSKHELASPIISIIRREDGNIVDRIWLNSEKDYEKVDRSRLIYSIQVGHIVKTYYQNPIILENDSKDMPRLAELFLEKYKAREKVNVIITYRFPRENGKFVDSEWFTRGRDSAVITRPILRPIIPGDSQLIIELNAGNTIRFF